jgi:multidrug efflux system membrane fusion protein
LPKVLQHFKSGEPMTVEAFDRDGRTLLATGKLVTIDNQIDPSTGTVKLRAEFPNTDETLFPNQFVNVQLIAEQIQGATVVPTAAVQRSTTAIYVYVVTDKKTASVRQIETGPTERGMVVVSKGLAPGEVVVVDGVDKLRDGSTIELVSRTTGTTGAAGSVPDKPSGRRGGGDTRSPQN